MTWSGALRDRANGLPIAILLALALVVAGSSHRLLAQADDPALQAYLDAGGSLSSLCSQTDQGAVPVPGCPLCVLAHAAVLPRAEFTARPAPRVLRLILPPARDAGLHPRLASARHAIRAPPAPG